MTGAPGQQLALALGPYDNRKLFSDHFLRERLPAWPEFAAAGPASLLSDLAELWDRERSGLARSPRTGRGALDVLDANAKRLKIDPRSRLHRERITTELESSAARAAEHGAQLVRLEREVDVLVAEAYGLTAAQRAHVYSEYD